MRNTSYLLLLTILLACGRVEIEEIKKEPIRRLKAFEYPLDSLGAGKIFVYRNGQNELSFSERKKVTEDGVDYLLIEWYDAKGRNSSERHKITFDAIDLVNAYIYDNSDSLTGEPRKDYAEIIESRNLNDGSKYRGFTLELKVVTPRSFVGRIKRKQNFIREDKLQIKGQTLDILNFADEIQSKAWYAYLPFFSSETIYTGENYYARGFGLVKYSTKTNKEETVWTLEEIRNSNQR